MCGPLHFLINFSWKISPTEWSDVKRMTKLYKSNITLRGRSSEGFFITKYYCCEQLFIHFKKLTILIKEINLKATAFIFPLIQKAN